MLKLSLINIAGTLATALTLYGAHMDPVLAAGYPSVTRADQVNVVPLLGMTRAQLVLQYPSLNPAELDKLVFRIGDTLSLALQH